MTVTEFRAYIKNVYAACSAMETAAQIPAGETGPLARLIVAGLLEREAVDVPKV